MANQVAGDGLLATYFTSISHNHTPISKSVFFDGRRFVASSDRRNQELFANSSEISTEIPAEISAEIHRFKF